MSEIAAESGFRRLDQAFSFVVAEINYRLICEGLSMTDDQL